MSQSFEAALASWREVVGERFVITSADSLDAASTATFPTDSRVLAVVMPDDHSDVQACMRIACEHQVAVYPISCGRNWGLGSRVPSRDAVLLDLSRMNRILEYDERLGFMVVQPGVTFRQASEFLLQKQSPFFLTVTGGSPLGSVIGNVAERGEGAGPYGQRADFVANLRAVLPNGDTVHSGFGKYALASAQHVHKSGVGPGLESLLTQSSCGVITQLTVWLTPRPAVLKPFVAQITNREHLAPAIDTARELLLHRIVEPNGIGIWNSIKISSTLGSYPWDAMEGQTPLDPQRFPPEPWIIGGAIYGASDDVAAANGTLLEEKLQPLVDHWQWCDGEDANNAYLGVPTEQNIRCAYWRKKSGLPVKLDPDSDRCGLIWICFAVPLIGADVLRAIDVIQPIIYEHGLEPNVGFNCISGRCAHLYVSLVYDREVDGEDARAVACHDKVVAILQSLGHLPYRLGLLSMSSLPACGDQTDQWIDAIKQTLDPDSLLSPGRYQRS